MLYAMVEMVGMVGLVGMAGKDAKRGMGKETYDIEARPIPSPHSIWAAASRSG